MECDRMREWLESYADGQATAEETAQVVRHLQACPACSRQLRWIQALKASVRAVPRPALPADLRAELLRQASSSRGPAGSEWLDSLRLSWKMAAGFGFASAFAAAAGFVAFNRFFSSGTEALSLDEVLVAHGRYELTMPAADREAIYAGLAGGGPENEP